MTSPDLDALAWRKSRRSANQGGACVEVAAWRKSSRSNESGGACIEVAGWRKSSRSGTQGGTCVELAVGERAVLVRDSKDPEGAVLAFGAGEWKAFVRAIGR
jgi:hypothetical protein